MNLTEEFRELAGLKSRLPSLQEARGLQEAGGVNVGRLERFVSTAESELRQLKHSLGLYKRDPGKYEPQLQNFKAAVSSIMTIGRVVLRTLGESAPTYEGVSSMSAGTWYKQVFRGGEEIYFKAKEQQKNGGWKGMIVQYADSGHPKKAKQMSVRSNEFRLWTEVPASEVPKDVRARLGESLGEAIVQPSKLFKAMQDADRALVDARVKVRKVHEMLTDVYNDASGVSWTDAYQDSDLKQTRDELYDLDRAFGAAMDGIARTSRDLKKKTA